MLPIEEFVPKALAQAPAQTQAAITGSQTTPDKQDKLGLIAILVEEGLMQDAELNNKIMTFASDVQSRIPHSKAFVLEVAPNESTYRISAALEKLHNEGIDTDLIDNNPLNNNSRREDENRLVGTIIVGDVPIPVVHETGGQTTPSIYPYVDFYRKRYIYDHEQEKFMVNSEVPSPTPEIWHGLIVPPSKDPDVAKEELITYFDKNHQYSEGEADFIDFEKRFLYANYPEMEKQMNYLDYRNYDRYIRYMEEMVMERYNRHLLKEVVKEVSIDMDSANSPIIDEASIDQMLDIHTKPIFEQFTSRLSDALRIYRSGINDKIDETGRWTPHQVDSPESLIAMRDDYAKHDLRYKQHLLEREVDEYIKATISEADRKISMPHRASLNVKLKILDQAIDSNTFFFESFIDGMKVQAMTSIDQCSIQMGQRKPENQEVLQNNSVLVNANRLYDIASLIQKEDVEDTDEYKDYGGCVFNNSITNTQTGSNPAKCAPEKADKSIFSVLGSKEVPEDALEVTYQNRCDKDQMIFKPINDDQFDRTAAGGTYLAITVGQDLEDVINKLYADFNGNLSSPSVGQKGSYVIKEMIDRSSPYTYSPLPEVEVEVSLSTQNLQLDSFDTYIEPTYETLSAIAHLNEPRLDPVTGQVNYPQIITPNTPADGIHFVSFRNNNQAQRFDYMNFFRVEGQNPGQITNNLIQQMNQKQLQLNQLTGTAGSTIRDFFTVNSDVREPIIWKSLSIDQKLAQILPKYLDQNSDLPTHANNPPISPQNQPSGYEVWHLVANGDAKGYVFGLNRAMQKQAPGTSVATSSQALNTTGESDQDGGADFDENNYVCGDPSGVEIWEWFDALQCWIDEEILPAHELFSVSNMCGTQDVLVEEEEELSDILGQILAVPTEIRVEMKRQSLVKGQEAAIKISALDQFGNPMLGFIDIPIHLELGDEELGSFRENDVYLFTGEKQITFTASPNKTGSTQLSVSMGDFETILNINVYEYISIDWIEKEVITDGRSEFAFDIRLRNPSGDLIQNINDTLLLAPAQPATGGFTRGGRVTLKNGQGNIEFRPTPGHPEILLMTKDGYLTGEHTIYPTTGNPTHLVIETPSYIPIGSKMTLKVMAQDDFGYPGANFNETVTVTLDPKSQQYAQLINPQVTLQGGIGEVEIQAGKESADINLAATHDELRTAEAQLPLLARVDSEEWKGYHPQNLFASFVGFPAGNFTQEDYFGGVHLFGGKTQAVYSFLSAPAPEATLSIAPNHLITLTSPSQTVYTELPPGQILFQVFDQATVRTQMTKRVNLNFDSVELLENERPKVGSAYLEMLDSDHRPVPYQDGFEIKNLQGKSLLSITTNSIRILDQNHQLVYRQEPEFGAPELILTDGLTESARLILHFQPKTLQTKDFESLHPQLYSSPLYSGKSVSDATGLIFHDVSAEVPEVTRAEFYGLEGDQKYLSLFASGTSAGEATKYNMPTGAILLGDPTIHLPTRSTTSLNYNTATGQQIFQDPENAQIASINHLNFNNDDDQDLVVLMEDGRVRLLEGGPTDPPYLDRGNIALLADEGVTMETFDFKNDDYEDILVATNKGRLAILNNDDEVITRTDQQLNIGKKMYKLIKADMDQDGFDDLVIHDSRGDILIFYYDSVNRRFPENGQLIGNYGFSVNINDNLAEGMQVRYAGLVEPQTAGPNVQPSNQSPQDYSGGGNISDADAQAFIDAKNAEAEAGRQGDTNASSAEVPKLPWPEDGELQTYFEPIENVRFLSPTKSIANKDRPGAGNVDLEETLTYTIELQSSVGIQDVVLADTLIDALSFNKDSVTCVQGGCESMEVKKNSTLLFFSGLNLSPTQPTIITYDALVSHTPASAMLAQKIDEPNQNLTNPASIIDPYTDVLISPPYNNSGRLIYHYSTGPRSYKVTVDNPPEPKAENAASPMQRVLDSMAAVQSGNFDGDNPPPPLELPPEAEGALMDATGGGGCTDSYESFVNCGNKALDDIADAIGNFACSGGGCWPMPWNYAFMVPPQTPFPIFSFPTTLPTPVGPVPFIWPGSFIGASNIPGPIMSQLRIYLSPTLTGGLGTAMCWGPYNPTPPPPPLFPIPYPPPIGNCIVKALPVQDMYGDLCETIEDGMDTIMDNIAAGVNWIESNVDEAASQLGGSAQIGGAAPNSSGLEISLAVNLGNSMRFEPPTKSFSNTHIPSFDSIGGAISDWFDRQTLEIQNKLLTFPTLSIYLPDFKTLFALDFSRTEKRFTQWKNQMSGNPYVNPSEDKGFPLEEMGAIQGGVNVANSLDGLYDVASTLPLVRLTEKPINFEIPWLSAGEIQSYIIELQNAVIYYEREYARVKDQWEAISCQDQPQAMTKEEAAENARNCQMRKLAESFGVSMDEFTNSVKENIEVLQSYLNYPKKLIKFKMQLADYIRSVACYIDVLAQMMGGWMATIRQQMISWAEMILTIAAIIDNIEQLFDLFVDFDDSCNICTNERYANFGWFGLLGLLLPDIPIIEFPKIPDIVLDMSDMEALIDIDLPILNLRTIPIPLPPIPYITLPDLPSIDAFLSLPPLPILPRLPELPDLPKLPPIPTIDLPTLPPPPKLPDLGESFDLIIPLIEKVLKIWCMMKKSFAPVPEMMLNDQISLLTNRPDYLIPLDVLKVQLPNFALFDIGFNEIRIETIVYLGLRINVIAKPLEEASADWNDWIRTVPEEMNAFYQEWIIETEAALQNQIDEVEQQLDAAAQSVETFVEEDIQGLLDKGPGELFDEADEYLREREEAWQDWADQANIEWTYDDYNIAVNNAFDTLSKAIFDKSLGDLRAGVRNAFENEGFGAAINILFPITYLLEKGDEANIDKEIQDILNEVRAEEEEIEITPPAPQASINRENMLNTPQGQEIIQIMTQISDIFEDVNERELVDYTVLKERFGVPDYNPTPQKTTVDKMEWMRNELIAHSDALMMEAESLQGVQDLHVIAGIPPRNPLPYELASEEFGKQNEEGRVYTNAMPRSNTFAQVQTGGLESANNQLREKVERQVAQTNTTNPEPSSSSSCKADLCLPDPILNKPVPVIPHIDLLPTSKTVFMPSGHLVYTDGSGLYLKRDLTVEETKDNTNSSQPAQFSFGDNFLARLGMEPYPKEAVNMLRSDIIKNEASSFSWRPSTHPAVYGYGIELERVISGYDPDQQNNQMADTRIILLPPTEESAAPEAYADDQLVTYGTLMTSMTDLEEASRRFGVSPKNIVGGISEARFPTINNAKINLNEYRAVYLDQLQGSAYDVEMENGFYQIKMTWFDDQALTATYNQNEILAPQLQADAAEPLDVSQTDIYYAPIFKEKTISASEIFVDLSDSYNYYWFINPDENSITPQVGDSLTLPAQTSEKTIKVKLVATQDLADDSYERFEKIFSIQIYIPSIELDADKLAEGIVAGNMTPIDEAASDNLSGIPFSVFRNRNNTWKNIGILRDEDPDKAATSPPLENPQTYYTIDAAGTYHIEGFDFTEPSSIDLKDQSANLVAQVQPGTGRIDLFDSNYELRAVAAGTTSPTHIAIVHKDSEEILGNVYYVSSAASKIKIVESGLTSNNVTTSGTTVGDLNTGDDFIAANIPDQGPSFPGGVAIFNQTPPQVNVALIDRDGTIRMMQDGYSLQLKNPNDPNGRYIFQIVNSSGRAIFDVFIQANFENLNIDKSTVMNELGGQIGLNPSLDRTFAQLNPTGEKLEVTTTDSENPFPDLNETHPYFKQILELYKARVISGYGDGSFRPDQKLTRAEFVKIALGVTNCYDCTEPTDPQKAKYTANPFPDVSLPAWYFYCISIAKELGMITGYGDGFFRPDRNISRAEAAAVLLRQSGIELSEAPENFFKDVPDYAWYVDYVYTAVEIGLIKESFGFVNPDEEITRGEFAFMAAGLKDYRECRLVDEDGDGLPDWWEMRNNLDPLVADLDQACPCFDNPNQSDSDQDGIRDVCDLDIDNDGILNPICIFDARGQIDQALLETGALTLGEPTDNCIFIANEDQADIDGNAIGNVCEVECACLDNPNKNDTDGDGIRDVCDSDIDNDSIPNPICVFDDSGLLNEGLLNEGAAELAKEGLEIDNCLFDQNPDQADGDLNGAGDICEESDLCPEVPEDLDGVDDQDGCPELNDNFPETDNGVYVGPGELCGFIDYTSEGVAGDVFMTAITDLDTHDVLHATSPALTYQ